MSLSSFFRYLRVRVILFVIRAGSVLRQYQLERAERQLWHDIERRYVRIPSRSPGRFIGAWLYYPQDYDTSPPSAPKPILINWHGSGFVMPGLSTDRAFCARVVRETKILVLDADYRKGPECPFPAPVEDAEDTFRWIKSQSQTLDLSRVAVSGFSAGGNLALVASSSMKDLLSGIGLRAVIAFYPPTDISVDPGVKAISNPVNPIPVGLQRIFNDCYVPEPSLRSNAQVSPSFADKNLFPDIITIITCSGDTLSPEANSLAEKLKDGNRHVRNVTLEGMFHAFDKGCKEGTNEWKQREIAYSSAIETLREALL